MNNLTINPKMIVRRTKLYVPVNREKFVEKAWTRDADCIILDLEDSIAPNDKATARKMIKDVIPNVSRGGAEIQVRINREFEEEDLDAAVIPGLTGLMITKCESAAEIEHLDELVKQLEKERNLPEGNIQFDLIFETARGIINVERVATASPRIVSITTGQADLSVDLGFTRLKELNFEQFFYAENKVLYAAHAAKVQPHGIGAQSNVDFSSISMGPESILKACRHAYCMGYMGTSVIHPGWIKAANEGFTPPQEEVNLAQKLKVFLDEAYANGQGAVSLDGRMYDIANMKHVDNIIARAEAIKKREAEKAAALKATGKIS
jgi:citrate lyase subunit beta/citryl-CoA lyase